LADVDVSGDDGEFVSTFCYADTTSPHLTFLNVDEEGFLPADWGSEPSATGLMGAEHAIAGSAIRKLLDANPRLKRLEIMGDCWWYHPRFEGLRVAMVHAGAMLKRRNVSFRVLHPPGLRRFVPPYLFGEQKPENVLFYANDEDGFRRTWEGAREEGSDTDFTDTSTDEDDAMEYEGVSNNEEEEDSMDGELTDEDGGLISDDLV
jgi:hypothetical protein